MPAYSSKELYMMNGGNTLYIYKDGFGDIYKATAAEEAEWSKEVVANALERIDKESNVTNLRFAINDLLFHGYKEVDQLLLEKIQYTTHARTIVFATLLWTMKEYENSFGIIYQLFLNYRSETIDDVFYALGDFKNNVAARKFLLECIKSDDHQLQAKAHTTLTMWSYTGMPEIRAAGMLEALKNRQEAGFANAILQLRMILSL